MAKQQSNKDSDKKKKQGNIRLNAGVARTGLNLDSSIDQVGPGRLTYALNAAVENFDSSSVNYQNEPGNEFCLVFTPGYRLIGEHFIPEKSKNIFFLANPDTGGSEIGFMDNNDCTYRVLINADCLNFNISNPIPKVVHRITNCTTEIYWTDGVNSRRYLDIENIPYKLIAGTPSCDPVYGNELDCNQIKIQPNFDIPNLDVIKIENIGDLVAGTYQFAIQYADANGDELTSYYSVTNPTPIADKFKTSVNFNYTVGKSIVVRISNLDLTGQFQYFNLAVIKTINNISSVELVGTYNIEENVKEVTYTGQDQSPIKLAMIDIFEKFPYYDVAQDVTAVQDILVWDNLTSAERINYQSIANQITLQWETHRIPATENYSDELNAANLRGYMRDEVYAFEIVFLLKDGKQTDGFHIPGREKSFNEQLPSIPETQSDFIGEPDYYIGGVGYLPYWKVYNTGSVSAFSSGYEPNNLDYKGPYQFGEFSYWESTEEYPCNDVWGDLGGTPIRHHKFPDVLVSPIIENGPIVYNPNGQAVPAMQDDAVFPIGVKLDDNRISLLILTSNLTEEQKDEIVGYKIVRGDRGTNKSVIAKGILRNVGKYNREGEDYIYPNYPYNDLNADPFLLQDSNSYSEESKSWLIYCSNDFDAYPENKPPVDPTNDDGDPIAFSGWDYQYISTINSKPTTGKIQPGETVEICSLGRPKYLSGKMIIGPAEYDVMQAWTRNAFATCGHRIEWLDPFNDENINGNVRRDIWLDDNGFAGTSDKYTVIVEKDSYLDGDPIRTSDCGTVWPFGDCCKPRRGWIEQPCQPPVNCRPIPLPTETYPLNEVESIQNFPDGIAIGCHGGNGINTSSDKFTSLWANSRTKSRRSTLNCGEEIPLEPLTDVEGINYVQIFNSPDTSFGQPFLGNVLKLESVMFGAGKGHFVEVKDNAKYKLLSLQAQKDALKSAIDIAGITNTFDPAVVFTVYQTYLTIYINGITRKNYAMSYNSRANYDYSFDINNNAKIGIPGDGNYVNGIKQRDIETARYLIPGVQSVDKIEHEINNWNRESSVIIKTVDTRKNDKKDVPIVPPLPFPSNTPTLLESGENIQQVVTLIIRTPPDAGVIGENNSEDCKITLNGETFRISVPTIPPNNTIDECAFTITNYFQDLINEYVAVQQGNIVIITALNTGPQLDPIFDPFEAIGMSAVFQVTTEGDSIGIPGDPIITDKSRFTISGSDNCPDPQSEVDLSVVSYYGSIKNIVKNQYGQIYSYQTIDTGYQSFFQGSSTIFGGDTFISRFSFKTKVPFFIDNRVGAPDDSDVFYDEIGNVAYPKYWHSSRSILQNASIQGATAVNFFSTKAHNFDCPNDPDDPEGEDPPVDINGQPVGGTYRTFYDGYFYLFAYGIPNFYCETVYNTDLRQAFNNKEGDFWPHISSGIPDDWLQETNVPIVQDNTYYYNVTFSKQNKENVFTHLPSDWKDDLCFTVYPFRAVYSDPATASADIRVNNWLVYRALSFHDFPQNYGNLTSLDGIQNKAILARFENKSLLYNNLLTIDTSNPQAAYIGNPNLFDGSPPIDFAETDLGYVGAQNKFLLKIPQGQITVDAKRGQVFLVQGAKVLDLTGYGSGVNRFMTDHLPFEILEYFPEISTDNHFNGIGLHGVYDSKFERIIITKLDYIPIDSSVKYDAVKDEFYKKLSAPNVPDAPDPPVESDVPVTARRVVYLDDPEYFCNKSWTMSFDFNSKSWISFHSYLPNFYIGENNFFYSGTNECCVTTDKDKSGGFNIIAGPLVPPTLNPITTTTTTAGVTTTTTSGRALDCIMDLGTFTETNCTLEGNGLITVPSPTTTTTCAPLSGPVIYANFNEGYQIPGESPVITTSSYLDVCNAQVLREALLPTGNPPLPISIPVIYQQSFNNSELLIGTRVYYQDDPCNSLPEGWYYSDVSTGERFSAIHINTQNVIDEIVSCDYCINTTTTTTMAPGIIECCSAINTTSTDMYVVNLGTTSNLSLEKDGYVTVPGYVSSATAGVAWTSTKLWTIDADIKEWDITLSPFSATFNRDITYGATPNIAGNIAISNTLLLGVDVSTSPQEIVEIDVTTTTAVQSSKFAIQANRIVISNLLYSSTGKLVLVSQDTVSSDYYLTQYNYSDGNVDLDTNIGTVRATVIYECECLIRLIDSSDYNNVLTYIVKSDGTITSSGNYTDFPYDVISGAVSSTFLNCAIDNTTTTTSSTSTTTTSTTLSPTCNGYEVTGPTALYYTNCYGQQVLLSVPSGQTSNVCASVAIPGATLIGSCL